MPNELALVMGASSGIGFSLAKELATRGFDLVICSESERLQDAAAQLEEIGTQVRTVQADLATRDGVAQLSDSVENLAQPLDIACINAGTGVGGLFEETDLDEELNSIELNCVGTVQLAKYVVRHMRERNHGKILFTASIAGEMVAPRQAVYAATKAFDLSFAHSLRYELRDTDVSVK
jgi:short-subunit dehydrogenase